MPGGLTFSQDIFLNTPLLADWHTILAQKEQLVIDTLLCANKKHVNLNYQIGQKFLKYYKTPQGKLEQKTTGPFDILQVHSNGTVTICLQPGITEQIIVCHTLSFKEHTFVILF